MASNYPDGLSEGSRGVPWEGFDEDNVRLVCDTCGEEPEDEGAHEEGDPCENTEPTTHNGIDYPPCTGHYRWECSTDDTDC